MHSILFCRSGCFSFEYSREFIMDYSFNPLTVIIIPPHSFLFICSPAVAKWRESYTAAGWHGTTLTRWGCKWSPIKILTKQKTLFKMCNTFFGEASGKLNKCLSDRLLLLSPDDRSLLYSCVTVIVCSLHIETLKRIPVALWDYSAEQRSNVPSTGLLGAWPPTGHFGEVSLSMSNVFLLTS